MSRGASFKFTLYVAGSALNSLQARANLATLCETYLRGRNEVELVDVFQQPGRALAAGIFMTPTLVMHSPRPARRIVGTLNQQQVTLAALGIEVGP